MNTPSTVHHDAHAPRRWLVHLPSKRLNSLSAPIVWGVVWGAAVVASPLGFWWLPPTTVYACGIFVIAAIYIGFSVADGRRKVIAVETGVATAFIVLAAIAITGSTWLIVAGLTAHGIKDFWQHRTRFVANTRWWPPFCATIDWVAAAALTAAIVTGVDFS